MDGIRISLFGRFHLQCGAEVRELEAQKAQELLAYLLVYRSQAHFREKLATMLWPDSTPSQSKGYLRQTLWQLQSVLGEEHKLLQLESDWIRIDVEKAFWLDVAIFEEAFDSVKGKRGSELDASQRKAIEEAVAIYQADLLENWYQDWCVFERERLQNLYLAMLDKLLGYCEAVGASEPGLIYATKILRCDRAHERTYRRMMRLYYQAGDRTRALREFMRCSAILQDELGVRPSQRTVALYEQIQAERPLLDETSPDTDPGLQRAATETDSERSDVLIRLNRLKETLLRAQLQVEREIDVARAANLWDS